MATTSTNKQPLLVDRVFHNAVPSNSLTSGSDTDLNILGTNESAVLVNCTANDGGIVEDLYLISRGTSPFTALFYFSSSLDYLRPNESVFVGKTTSASTSGDIIKADWLPKVLAPLPGAGSESQVNALYVPKGKALWCTLQLAGPANTASTPIIGAQGGFY